ncbi:Adhesive plaque matrix protein [Labeo rohita]|uniref:Adhesive plaque matrix protein n=1 Tax=Labeo rohita TaxID=84645 RepID=A0ABQ8LZ88_LABRO|nr:Adhesive plaque matrix protein [Labeo rohita]
MNLVGDLRSAHHQMPLSPCPYTQTVALHPGLHLPSSSALIGSAPVTSQACYKSPSLSPCYSRSILSRLAISSRLSRCLPSGLSLVLWTSPLPFPIGLHSPRIDPRLPLRLFLCLAPYIPVFYCSDPACLTMSLSHRLNKSLHLDPLASRLTPHVTEYSVPTGSSSFTHGRCTGMDTTRILFRLKQGPRTLEQHICEFLAIANLPDCILIKIFCDGINEPLKVRLRCEGLRSSLAAFMDFALLSVGSSFTVSVADEERDIAVTLATQPTREPERIHKMAAASECVHAMAATAEPEDKMAAAPVRAHKMELCHITAAIPEPCKVAAVFPRSSQVKAVFSVSRQVKAALPKSSQATAVSPKSSQDTAVVPESSKVTAVVPESSKVTAVIPESSKVKAVLPESSKVTAVVPESSRVTAVIPESSKVKAVVPEPSQVRAVVPEPSQVSADLHESGQVATDLYRPSQVTADLHEPSQVTTDLHKPGQATAGLHEPSQASVDLHEPSHVPSDGPESSHVPSDGPESSYIPSDGPESSHVPPDGPESSHVPSDCPEPRHVSSDTPRSWPIMMASIHKSAPEVMSVHKSAHEGSSDHKSAPEILSVLKSAPEVSSDHKSAPEVSPVHKSAPEVSPVHKSAPEVSSDHESAPEASPVGEAAPMPPEVSALSVEPPMEAAFPYELSASLLILSASSVPALPRSQSMTQVPAPPWRAPAPPAPPWRVPAPPAGGLLPWWAPALPVLRQSPGPPQGSGPPTLALFRPRPTAPLDCWWVGASGSRSLVGGYVMNLVGDLQSAHHQISLSPCPYTQTVTLHPGLHLPSSSALIGSAPVTNQVLYKSPGLSPCYSRSIVIIVVVYCIVVSLVPVFPSS